MKLDKNSNYANEFISLKENKLGLRLQICFVIGENLRTQALLKKIKCCSFGKRKAEFKVYEAVKENLI